MSGAAARYVGGIVIGAAAVSVTLIPAAVILWRWRGPQAGIPAAVAAGLVAAWCGWTSRKGSW